MKEPMVVDWRSKCSSIKDQASCGSCTAFGTIGSWEALLKIQKNEDIDLSEQNLFMCSGGKCATGNYMAPVLNTARDKGVPLESCSPYLARDSSCSDHCSEWWLNGKKLKSWKQIWAGMIEMKNELFEHGPIVATMAVYQSFLSYKSGIYHKLNNDPLLGYHCIALVGFDDEKGAWLLRNSWGTGWGIQGYCYIQYGDSEIEGETYALELDGEIPPDDDGDDSNCPIAKTLIKIYNVLAEFFGAKTRLKAVVPK